VISSGGAGSRAARSSDFGISPVVFANLRCDFPRLSVDIDNVITLDPIEILAAKTAALISRAAA